ncbi:PAC2 family protein [Klenkia terrae]|uniref:PAC2 family protein n=1 Tax=Klenkia terrae TaxID=1052259 RepID=UPI0036225CE0
MVAFEGWNDAGDAATGALEHLELIWDAEPLAALDPEDYYDFQVNRPQVSLKDGVSRKVEWPTTRISVARKPAGGDRDVVLVRGIEPNMRWRGFCAELIAILQELEVSTVVALGALLADTPHTRPTPVSGSAYDSESAQKWGLETSTYEGPTGILGVFQDACVQAGLPAVSFWAAVPHYVSQPPSPAPRSRCCTGWRRSSSWPCRWAGCPSRPSSGCGPSTRWPPTTTRSWSTCAPWRSGPPRATCPRPTATRSRESSSAT